MNKKLLLFAALLASTDPGRANVTLASPFTDHAVLQRGMAVPVWGNAKPGEAVEVSYLDQKASVKADGQGHWIVRLAPMAGNLTGNLVVTGQNTIKLTDVVTGEVWLCSGQSNMALQVHAAKDAEKEIAAGNNPQVRVFVVFGGGRPQQQTECGGRWLPASPATVGGFSATAYYFGRDLQAALNVPVGLIQSAVGGTPIEAWTSVAAQKDNPALQVVFAKWKELEARPFDEKAVMEKYEKGMADWKAQAAQRGKPNAVPPKNIRRMPVNPLERKDRPGNLFNSKIAPLIPYAIRGVVWYQGEANSAGKYPDLYDTQLAALAGDWRTRWGCQFPFVWVQLPNFTAPQKNPVEDSGWVVIREKMLRALSIPQTGMVVTLGLGEAGTVHPKNKQDVGKRIALWALENIYDRKGSSGTSPVPEHQEISDDKVIVTFAHADGGLSASDGGLRGFALCGADRQWRTADARIEGNRVIITSPAVPKPIAARYAWAANPAFSLLNRAGLPASPFRTDEFPFVLTKPGATKESENSDQE